MHVAKSSCDVASDPYALIEAACSTTTNGLTQILSPQVLHHDERVPLVFPVIENVDDILVLKLAGNPSFLEKSGFGCRVHRSFAREDLNHDEPAYHRVARPLDLGHPAAKKLKYLVLADSRRLHHVGKSVVYTSGSRRECNRIIFRC
jgi:hypothetical protein